jgi:tRNA threonylcarbamoyladenosine biosynthesis protein TsaB
MRILAIDTATPLPSVTLLSAAGIHEESLPGDRRASEELLPAIERCLAAAGLSLAECDRIAVCSGPGSFTGLRIGLATAWALGRAGRVPVEGVPTLEALAETARGRADRVASVAVALDAGRGEVVLGIYSLASERAVPEEAPSRLPVDEARRRAHGIPAVSLPAGLLPGAAEAPVTPVSRALALAVARAPREERPADLHGIYSRPSAAQERRGAP